VPAEELTQARPSERFPKALRLRKRREFLQVQEGGQKVSADPLLALVRRNGRPYSRVGLTVSTKVGNAVVRARLRRLMRELYRKRRARWPAGLDVVLVARTSAKDADLAQLARAFDLLERRLPKLSWGSSGAPRGGGPKPPAAAPPPPAGAGPR
jgi:ribonuclease P protein component